MKIHDLQKCGGNELSFKRNYEGSRACREKMVENTKGSRSLRIQGR